MSRRSHYHAIPSVQDTSLRSDVERFLAGAPIYYQSWWLEATSPGAWRYAVVLQDDDIAVVMPYVRRKGLFGQIHLGMPSLTQTLGPWLGISAARHAQLAAQEDLATEIVDSLPPHHLFRQNFHYSLTNWLPFYWKGFGQTTRYTYVLQNLGSLDAIWGGFDEGVRTDIRKAEKRLCVVEDLGLERFSEISEMTFSRQGLRPPHSRDFLRRLDEACKAHNARKILFAVDAENRVHAACYIVWTEPAAYYLMAGADPDLRNSGAGSLLVWEAIRFARAVARTFDFEGSMLEPVERFFRAFGAQQMRYFSVSRDGRNLALKTYSGLRSLLARSARRPGWRR